jgi:HD superfamily phosphohydrolase
VLRVRDPIHDYIHLDELGQELVDTPRMQRLRRVHQLGTGSLVYPGANHTRFEHSLGAYHLAGQAATALGVSDEEKKAIQAAALLHDVGHGPFSHTCDPLYRDYLGRTHEDLAIEAAQKGSIRDALVRHGVAPGSVVALIHGEGPLGGLISGGIDVDRMDYLVRDGHYTGVRIGVDLERIVHDLALTHRGVALRADSVAAAETLLVTRVQMYATVYHHRTLRVSQRMIERAFRLAIDAGEIRPEQLPTMDDAAATMLLRHSKTDAWRWILAVDQRKLHKVALEEPVTGFDEAALAALAGSETHRAAIEEEIAKELGVAAGEVLLDVPEPPTIPETTMLVLADDGGVLDLAEVSTMTRSLTASQRDHWRLRVMVAPSRREAAGPVAARILKRAIG